MVSEASSTELRSLLASKGLQVEEKKSIQKTLDGRSLGYHSITGYREGAYKITIRLSPEPRTIHVVINAGTSNKASELANRLNEIGVDSDTDEEIVRGQTRHISKRIVDKIIELAEEATRR